MIDAGLQGACTGSVCCSPACSIRIGDFHGCGSSATFGGNCQYQYDYPDGTLDANGCDDVQVTLLRDPEGNPVYDLYHKPSKTYDRYQISNCKSPSPGGFCTVTGGGCVSFDCVHGWSWTGN
jgi:hypothetical protein